jgi:hypothetical protein
LVAQFGQALLDKARQEYPGAELANQELGFVPLSEDQEIERSDLGDGRVRIRADIVGTILVPAP